MWSTARKIGLILFVTWHMFSVGVYAVPRISQDKISVAWRMHLLPIVTPYMLMTSQWQLWNIFAPDPLRRVTFYRIETKNDDSWNELITYKPGTLSLWRHATYFKMFSNMLDEESDTLAPIAGRFLHLLCKEHAVASGTPVRLKYIYYIIPYHKKRQSISWWNAWYPEIHSYLGFSTTCP